MNRVIAVLGTFTILVVGCGGDDSQEAREREMEETAAQHGIDLDVTVNDDGEMENVAINTGSGQLGSGLDLPASFPSDVILPDNLNIMFASAPGQDMHQVQALSPDTTDVVLATLRENLSGEGWTEIGAGEPAPVMSKIAFEKNGRLANFVITDSGDTRAVQLVTMPKP